MIARGQTTATSETAAEAFFYRLTGLRIPLLLIGLLAIVGTGLFVPSLTRDTTADAFIDPASPALISQEEVEEIFGLADPIVVAVIDKDEDGVFDAETLSLVERLTEAIRRMPDIDPERVTSLATENQIVGVEDGLIVEGFFDRNTEHFQAPPGTEERAEEVRAAIEDFPLYQGSLVARDGSATIIVAELLDETTTTETYDALLEIVAKATIPDGVEIHIAGEGAVSGFLQTYIDRDAARLNPIAGIIITIVLLIAFMSVRSALLPNIIVLGTVSGSIGIMAAVGVDFYVITNGLIVNLIGIAVADSIHILSEFYSEQQADPKADKRRIVARAMGRMWRPVTLTTVTTIAGFLALALASVMPPVRFFGIFGALGVFAAWVYSMTLLPSMLSLWPSKRLPFPFRVKKDGAAAESLSTRMMRSFGAGVLATPGWILGVSGLLLVIGSYGASLVIADDARIENFKPSEPLYQADKAINSVMDGTYYLDVLVETDEPEGLYESANLRKMEALQEYLTTLPNVNGATSIVDYVKQLHRAVNEGQQSAYTLPDDPLLTAQLFFLYNASADPTDFEEEVETGFQRALIRANVSEGSYQNNKVLVPALNQYLETTFNGDGITGEATGRVNTDYYWINGIVRSNLLAVVLSFGAVLITAMLVFRSVVGGLIAASPVGLAVLVVYAVMGYAGIPLGVGTSMFSAIAIGLSIDFAIHGLDRIRELVREHGQIDDPALIELFPKTGRALLFNFIAVAGGFGVLTTSDVPPLVKFGSLVAVAVSTAFIASLTLMPALVKVLKPRFLTNSVQGDLSHAHA